MIGAITTLWRGGDRQLDFHVAPVWVEGGDENDVLVARGHVSFSEPRVVQGISSFLGVMPGDVVEMAVDVISDSGMVLYTRSIHKETAGIYDAWSSDTPVWGAYVGVEVCITCRVNAVNRDGEPRAFFEGLVRLTFGEDL